MESCVRLPFNRVTKNIRRINAKDVTEGKKLQSVEKKSTPVRITRSTVQMAATTITTTEITTDKSTNSPVIAKRPLRQQKLSFVVDPKPIVENKMEVKSTPDFAEKPALSPLQNQPAYKRFHYLVQPDAEPQHQPEPPATVVPPQENTASLLKRPRAYEKFQHLLTDSKPAEISSSKQYSKEPALCTSAAVVAVDNSQLILSTDLPLPSQFKILLQFFKHVDHIVNMIVSRKELCTFERLKASVERVCHRTFHESALAQIGYIYPDAFKCHWQKLTPTLHASVAAKWHLIVEVTANSTNNTKCVELIQRYKHFHQLLLQLVGKGHQKFLVDELNISQEDIPAPDKVKRWHPKFPLDDTSKWIPTIPTECDMIPPQPVEGIEQQPITSVQDAAAMLRNRGLQRQVEACEKVLLREPSSKAPLLTAKPVVKPTSAYRGLSSNLLEKIRQKEATKEAVRLATGGPEAVARRALVSRLPEVASLLWSMSVANKHRPVSHSAFVQRVANSHRSGLSKNSAEDHVKVLAELMSDWIEVKSWAEPHYSILDPRRPLTSVFSSILGHTKE